MAKLAKAERDRKQKGSMAEEFELTNETAFPSLEKTYWSAPNKPRGDIAMCSYVEPRAVSEKKSTTGI